MKAWINLVPCHKAQINLYWFLEDVTVLKCTPQLPDLNPIKHIWDSMEKDLHYVRNV